MLSGCIQSILVRPGGRQVSCALGGVRSIPVNPFPCIPFPCALGSSSSFECVGSVSVRHWGQFSFRCFRSSPWIRLCALSPFLVVVGFLHVNSLLSVGCVRSIDVRLVGRRVRSSALGPFVVRLSRSIYTGTTLTVRRRGSARLRTGTNPKTHGITDTLYDIGHFILHAGKRSSRASLGLPLPRATCGR